MTAENKFKIKKSGRFRLGASVSVGLDLANLNAFVLNPVNEIPIATAFGLNFANANNLATLKGQRSVVFINLNTVHQISVNSVVNVVAGDEFSLLGEALDSAKKLLGISAGGAEAPYVYVELVNYKVCLIYFNFLK